MFEFRYDNEYWGVKRQSLLSPQATKNSDLLTGVIFIYVRKSQVESENPFEDVQRQVINLYSLVDVYEWMKKGYKILWYVDADGYTPGWTKEGRDQYQIMVERIQNGPLHGEKFIAFVTDESGRHNRNTENSGELGNVIAKHEGMYYYEAGSGMRLDLRDPDQRFIYDMKGALSARYSNYVRMLTQQKIDQIRASGKLWGPKPFGTEVITSGPRQGFLKLRKDGVYIRDDGRWEYAPYERTDVPDSWVWRPFVGLVERVFDLILEGYGNSEIARITNDEGWAFQGRRFKIKDDMNRFLYWSTPQQRLKRLSCYTVRTIKRNIWPYGGAIGHKLRNKQRDDAYKICELEDLPWCEENAVFPVERLTEVVGAWRTNSERANIRNTPRRSPDYEFSHLFYCDHCETRAREANNPDLRYRLSANGHGQKYEHSYAIRQPCGCKRKSIKIAAITEQVLEIVEQVQIPDVIFDALCDVAHQMQAQVKPVKYIGNQKMEELRDWHQKKKRAADVYADGAWTKEDYDAAMAKIKREIAKLERMPVRTVQIPTDLREVVGTLRTPLQIREIADDKQRQQLMKSMFDYFVVNLDEQCITEVHLQPGFVGPAA